MDFREGEYICTYCYVYDNVCICVRDVYIYILLFYICTVIYIYTHICHIVFVIMYNVTYSFVLEYRKLQHLEFFFHVSISLLVFEGLHFTRARLAQPG